MSDDDPLAPLRSTPVPLAAAEQVQARGQQRASRRRALLAATGAAVLLLGAGTAYALQGPSQDSLRVAAAPVTTPTPTPSDLDSCLSPGSSFLCGEQSSCPQPDLLPDGTCTLILSTPPASPPAPTPSAGSAPPAPPLPSAPPTTRPAGPAAPPAPATPPPTATPTTTRPAPTTPPASTRPPTTPPTTTPPPPVVRHPVLTVTPMSCCIPESNAFVWRGSGFDPVRPLTVRITDESGTELQRRTLGSTQDAGDPGGSYGPPEGLSYPAGELITVTVTDGTATATATWSWRAAAG